MNKKIRRKIYELWMRFLTILGDLRWACKSPATGAAQIRRLIEPGFLQKGDIIFRGYSYYLDSIFLDTLGHSGVVVSDDGQRLVHSVAEGVCETDVINMVDLTDNWVVLRPNFPSEEKLIEAIRFVKSLVGKEYDGFLNDEDKWYCHEVSADFIKHCGLRITPITKLYGIWPLKFNKTLYYYESFLPVCRLRYEFLNGNEITY